MLSLLLASSGLCSLAQVYAGHPSVACSKSPPGWALPPRPRMHQADLPPSPDSPRHFLSSSHTARQAVPEPKEVAHLPGIFKAAKRFHNDIIMTDTYTFVQTHRACTSKGEPHGKPRTRMLRCRFISGNKCTSPERGCACVGQGVLGNLSAFLLILL